MIELHDRTGTSTGGASSARFLGAVAIAALTLGTAATDVVPADDLAGADWLADSTSAGVATPAAPERHAEAVLELRSISGLSWEQLARLFGVSRRAAHLWAAGNPMSPSNEEHLHRCLAVLKQVDCGASAFNRAALFDAAGAGVLPYDLLIAREYNRAAGLLRQAGPRRVAARSLPAGERAKRLPPPPAELMGGAAGKAHVDRPGTRAGKSVKVRGERTE